MQDKILRQSQSLMYCVQPAAAPDSKPARAKFPLLIFAITVLTQLAVLPISALGQPPFYQDKTIKIIVAATPGGTGDFRVRALAPFLRKYIPGNPTVISSSWMVAAVEKRRITCMRTLARTDSL